MGSDVELLDERYNDLAYLDLVPKYEAFKRMLRYNQFWAFQGCEGTARLRCLFRCQENQSSLIVSISVIHRRSSLESSTMNLSSSQANLSQGRAYSSR